MNNIQFLQLEGAEQAEFINNLLLEGKTIKEISRGCFNKSQSWLGGILNKKGYFFKQGQYVKRDNINNDKGELLKILNDIKITEEEFKKIILLNKERLHTKNDKREIEIDPQYFVNEKGKTKTFLGSEKVFEEWDQFCKKNFIFQNQHLLSMALIEYMEKYK